MQKQNKKIEQKTEKFRKKIHKLICAFQFCSKYHHFTKIRQCNIISIYTTHNIIIINQNNTQKFIYCIIAINTISVTIAIIVVIIASLSDVDVIRQVIQFVKNINIYHFDTLLYQCNMIQP